MGFSINAGGEVKEGRGCWAMSFHTGGLVWLQSWGASPDWKAQTKRVPERIWRSSLAVRKAFLLGFMFGDGYAHDGLGYSVINLCQRSLLEELWLLFRTVGVDASKIRGPFASDKKGHVSFKMKISGAMMFTVFGWGRECKLRTSSLGYPPWWVAYRNKDKLKAQSKSDLAIIWKLKKKGKTSISAYKLAQMGVTDAYDHDAVSHVTSRGVRVPVYTLSVDDPSHQYVAQGIISKNSTESAIVHDAEQEILNFIPFGRWGHGTGIVHEGYDSLMLEVPEDQAEYATGVVEHAMNRDVPGFGVKFTAKAKVVKAWYEPACGPCSKKKDPVTKKGKKVKLTWTGAGYRCSSCGYTE